VDDARREQAEALHALAAAQLTFQTFALQVVQGPGDRRIQQQQVLARAPGEVPYHPALQAGATGPLGQAQHQLPVELPAQVQQVGDVPSRAAHEQGGAVAQGLPRAAGPGAQVAAEGRVDHADVPLGIRAQHPARRVFQKRKQAGLVLHQELGGDGGDSGLWKGGHAGLVSDPR